jgi:hypothetical protein
VKRAVSAILYATVTILCGCASEGPDDGPASTWWHNAIDEAPTVRAYTARIAGPYACLVDEEGDDHIVVAVGESTPTHFTRAMTMRVTRGGAVYVRDDLETGDTCWRPDIVQAK